MTGSPTLSSSARRKESAGNREQIGIVSLRMEVLLFHGACRAAACASSSGAGCSACRIGSCQWPVRVLAASSAGTAAQQAPPPLVQEVPRPRHGRSEQLRMTDHGGGCRSMCRSSRTRRSRRCVRSCLSYRRHRRRARGHARIESARSDTGCRGDRSVRRARRSCSSAGGGRCSGRGCTGRRTGSFVSSR